MMTIDPADPDHLRAKYLDWCSAKVADRFLALTPDQIYDLAYSPSRREPARASALSLDPDPMPTVPRDAAEAESGMVYRGLVERVTEVLAVRLRLPSFEEWAALYRAEPERYEAELLGFWRPRSGGGGAR